MITTAMSNYTYKNLDTVLDTQGMRSYFEDHMVWLRNKCDTHRVEPMNAYRFKHDLAAYLRFINVEPGLHWLYMRINGKIYNWQFDENDELLYIPKMEDVETIIDQYALLSG